MSRDPGKYVISLFVVLVLAACRHAGPLVAETAPEPTPPAGPQAFATPQDAASALVQACRTNDVEAVDRIFGEMHRDLVLSGDQAADAERCQRFVRSADAMTRLDPWGDRRLVLVVGADDWAFPVPIVQSAAGWHFDPEAGAAEVLRRRAGENEIHAIGECRSWAEQHVGEDLDPDRPFHGYYFQILAAPRRVAATDPQGRDAEGGIALVAWPAEYRITGVESFLVGPDGVVLEKDLGPAGAGAMATYDPYGWQVVGAEQ